MITMPENSPCFMQHFVYFNIMKLVVPVILFAVMKCFLRAVITVLWLYCIYIKYVKAVRRY